MATQARALQFDNGVQPQGGRGQSDKGLVGKPARAGERAQPRHSVDVAASVCARSSSGSAEWPRHGGQSHDYKRHATTTLFNRP